MELVANILISAMIAATPLVFAAIGELVAERAGVLNLGVEGMMIVGAVAGFSAVIAAKSLALALAAAMVGGAVMALLFGVLTLTLRANQVASGLALTMFGLGLSALWGQGYSGLSAPAFPRLSLPLLTDLPLVGKLLFGQDGLIYLSFAMVVAVAWVLERTRFGLILRAIGENHDAAHAIGYPVIGYRYLALMFGGITILQLHSQALGVKIDAQLLSMLPYLATIFVLVIISRDAMKVKLTAPACLGKPFHVAA